MDDRIAIALKVVQTSFHSVTGIGDGIARVGLVQRLLAWWKARPAPGGVAREAAPPSSVEPKDPAAQLDALARELNALSADPTAELSLLLDGWMERLAAVPLTVDPARRIGLLIDGGVQYYWNGVKVARSLPPLAQAAQLATQTNDQLQLRRALSVQGLVKGSLLDTTGALQDLTRALTIGRSLEDEYGVAAAWLNIGVALHEAGLFADSLICAERADRALKGLSNPRYVSMIRSRALHVIGTCARALGRYEEAVSAHGAAVEQLAQPEDHESELVRALIEGTYTFTLLDMERLDEAEDHARICDEMATRSRSTRAQVTASTAVGLVDVYRGRIEQGIARIVDSSERSRTIIAPYRDTLKALVAAYERAGQADRALDCLQELLEFNRTGRSVQLLKPFEELHRSLELASPQASVHDHAALAKAAELQSLVDERLADLVNTCVTNAVRSGYDQYRVFRVGALTEQFAAAEGAETERARAIGFAARLCDLGMMVIPDELLRKTRGLSDGERKIVDEHTLFGAEVLTRARLAVLQPCVSAAKYHHERWDGRGPWGLKGNDIPLEARMTSLADAFDSLTHARPWRPAKSVPAALRILSEEAGSLFDPSLAERFIAFVQREYWRHDDWDAHLSQDAHDNAYVKARAQIDRMFKSGA